jgi:hypothetical protein
VIGHYEQQGLDLPGDMSVLEYVIETGALGDGGMTVCVCVYVRVRVRVRVRVCVFYTYICIYIHMYIIYIYIYIIYINIYIHIYTQTYKYIYIHKHRPVTCRTIRRLEASLLCPGVANVLLCVYP